MSIVFSTTVRAERSEDRHRMTPIGVLRLFWDPCSTVLRIKSPLILRFYGCSEVDATITPGGLDRGLGGSVQADPLEAAKSKVMTSHDRELTVGSSLDPP